jgi:nucleotide-binding universal stress UspA family protein
MSAAERPLLLCYDGSEDAQLALARAGELFAGRRAIVLHVWEPLGDVASVPPVPGLEGVLRAGLEEMDKQGEEISAKVAEEGARRAREAGLDAEPMSVRKPTRAWRAILATAGECDAAAIILGRRGVSRVELKILGSVANAVVQHADRPVLIVPAP